MARFGTGTRRGAASQGVAGESATIRLGQASASIDGPGPHTRAFIAGIRGVTTDVADAVTVLIDSASQLGTVSSSRRFKENVEGMDDVSDALVSLRPVTFRYKDAFANGDKPLQYGLIAEEVAEVFPDLVVVNEAGEPETVKYRLLSILLLQGLQKQAQLVGVLEAEVSELAVLKSQVADVLELNAHLARLEAMETQRLAVADSRIMQSTGTGGE